MTCAREACVAQMFRDRQIKTISNIKVRFNPDGLGQVYLVTSRWIPGLVKIGASRQNIKARLSTSSIPEPVVVAVWREDAPWALEKRLHAALSQDLVSMQEWFRVEPGRVVDLVESWIAQEI